MKILLTGGTGFAGSHAARELLSAGHHLRLLVRSASKANAVFGSHLTEQMELVSGDLTDQASITEAMQGCDALVHAAAMVSLHESDSAAMYHTNVLGTQAVIGAAQAAGIKRIVYVSSISALYNTNGTPINELSPYAEATDGYGKSKLDADQWVRRQVENGQSIATVYPTGIIGPDDPGVSANNEAFIYFLTQTCVDTSSGQQMIDVRDLAQAIRLLLEAEASGPYVVGGHFMPWREVADTLEAVVKQKVRCVKVPGWLLRGIGHTVDAVRKLIPFDTLFTAESMIYATRAPVAHSDKLLAEFPMQFRPAEETLHDLVLWAAANNLIDEKWARHIKPTPAAEAAQAKAPQSPADTALNKPATEAAEPHL